MKFVDIAKINIRSGKGGKGCVSFRREKYVPKGGPNGGDGGRGGDVVFVANSQLNTLLDLKYHTINIAPGGQPGMGKNMSGKDAEDLLIYLPVGSLIKDAVTGEILADLDADGVRFVGAKGGRGGQGNQHFATATRQTPRFAQPGEPGEERDVIVELKLLADVGLVGLPNAGKSTLISVISGARPKVADYPFTTLVPNLGVVKFEDRRSFVVADIPGLIKGAHMGAGLGFHFLRHVERTRVLVHLVDISDLAEGDPVEHFETINRELREYSAALMDKPMAVAATKIDAKGDGEKLKRLEAHCRAEGRDFFAISAAAHLGLDPLLQYLSDKVME